MNLAAHARKSAGIATPSGRWYWLGYEEDMPKKAPDGTRAAATATLGKVPRAS